MNPLVLFIFFSELVFRSCFEIREDIKTGKREPNPKISPPYAVGREKTYSSSLLDLVILMEVFLKTPRSLYKAFTRQISRQTWRRAVSSQKYSTNSLE